MQFETKVTAAAYDERARRRWNVGTSRGEQISTKYGILATGLTSAMAACYFWPTAGMWARTFLANRERCGSIWVA